MEEILLAAKMAVIQISIRDRMDNQSAVFS